MSKETNRVMDKILADPTLQLAMKLDKTFFAKHIKPAINKRKEEDAKAFKKALLDGAKKLPRDKLNQYMIRISEVCDVSVRRIRRILRKAGHNIE